MERSVEGPTQTSRAQIAPGAVARPRPAAMANAAQNGPLNGSSVAEASHGREALALKRGADLLARDAHHAEAELLYRRALTLAPTFAEVHNNLGNVLSYLGRGEEAAASYRRALEHRPSFIDAHNNLGAWLAQRGKAKEAASEFRAALAIDPGFVSAQWNLAELPDEKIGTADVARLEAILAQGNDAAENHIPLLFMLARHYEREGRYDAAFELAGRANALVRRKVEFDPEAEAGFLRRSTAFLTEAFFRENQIRGSESELPIFIVGLPRSGTTLVEQIIASHPRAAGAGEMLAMPQIADGLQALAPDARFPDCLRLLDETRAKQLAEDYLSRLRTHDPAAERIIDKQLLNFRLLGLIALLLPQARVIHCRRDPRDTAISCHFTHFHRPIGFTYDLADFARYYHSYAALMAHWRRVLPVRILDVQYEDLATAPEAKIREMLAFCGLEWDERCLAFHNNDRPVRTASNWQVRQPLFETSVGRWRHYEKHIGRLLEALNSSAPASAAGTETAPSPTAPKSTAPSATAVEPPVARRQGSGSEEASALKQQGDARAREAQFAEAEVLYRRALAIAPDYAEALNNLGNVLSYQGRGEEAAECYRKALEHRPSLIDAHNNLGAWFAGQHQPEAAIRHLREVLRVDPLHAEAHLNLGKLLVQLGETAAAAEQFRLAAASGRASFKIRLESATGLAACRDPAAAAESLRGLVRERPLDASAHGALAMALGEQNRIDEAIFHARQAVEIEPRDGIRHAELALILKAKGLLPDAKFHARRGVELSPKAARSHLNLGSILESSDDAEGAVKAYGEAVRLDPNLAQAHGSLGTLLLKAGEVDRALGALRRAAALAPHEASVHSNLGIGLQDKGLHEEARKSYEKAIAIDSRFAEALCNLAMLEQQLGDLGKAKENYRRALELKPELSSAVLGLAQLATGEQDAVPVARVERMLTDPTVDNNSKAALHLALARTLDESGDHERAFEHAQEAHALEIRRREDGLQPEAMARRMIEVFDAGFFAERSWFGSRSELPVMVVGLPRTGTTLVEQILSSNSRAFGAGELMDLPLLAQRLTTLARISQPFPLGARELDEPSCLRLAGMYLQTLRRLGGSAERVIDKLPFNFWRLGLIGLLIPKARIINCRRHPLDVFISGYLMRFRNPIEHTGDQLQFAKYYLVYEELMAHWRKVLPNQILDVDYEDLVMRQEPVSREMVDYCGLGWEPACLEFYKNPRPVRTGSNAQVRRPMYAKSIGRWRPYAAHLQPLIDALARGGWKDQENVVRAAAG